MSIQHLLILSPNKNRLMKGSSCTKANNDSQNNSKDFTVMQSKDFVCSDPKASTFLTFATWNADKSRKFKRHRSYKKPNWNFSASTLTRDESPSHAIPQSKRFSSMEQDIKKNGKFLNLDLRKQLTNGVSFAKSQRKDYFIKKQNANYPSSATYHKNPEDLPTKGQQSLKLVNLLIVDNEEQQEQKKIHYINHTMNNNRRKKISEGITIGKFQKTHARFLHHGRQIPHTPEIFRNNPGVGAYNLDENKYSKPSTPSYSMRLVLQRFNDKDEQFQPQHRIIPGAGAYNLAEPRPHSVSSINQKGTFQQSCRTYLTNPNNKVPGPGQYETNK